MKINYVFEEYEWDWTAPYNEMAAWAVAGHEVAYIDTTDMAQHQVATAIENAPQCDLWYCFSFLDRWLIPIVRRSDEDNLTPIICHNHGGMETLDMISLIRGFEDTTMLPLLSERLSAFIMFNTVGNERSFCEFYGSSPASHRVVGYPISRRSGPENRVGILVPGRFSSTKQTMLAAAILLPWKRHVTFCTPIDIKCDHWWALAAMGYDVVCARGERYEELISSHKVGFTASMSDSMNASIAEMASTGALMVTPDRVPFNDPGYIHPRYRYRAFDIEDARDRIALAWNKSRTWEKDQLSYFLPQEVSQRVSEVLLEVGNVTKH